MLQTICRLEKSVVIHTSWKGVDANGSVWERVDSRQDTTQDKTDVAVVPIRLVC